VTRVGAAATTAAVLLLIAGCSGSPASDGPGGSASGGAAGRSEGTRLDGPWAQEFADAIAKSTSAAEREVLADGVVTQEELEDAHSGVRRCLADSGLEIHYFPDGGFETSGPNGAVSTMPFEKSDSILQACEGRYDTWITFLYEQTRRNPEQRDEATIEVACLRRSGVVDTSYSRADWQAENDTGAFSFDATSKRAKDCALDPLALWLDR
jgi:hypothetical protein